MESAIWAWKKSDNFFFFFFFWWVKGIETKWAAVKIVWLFKEQWVLWMEYETEWEGWWKIREKHRSKCNDFELHIKGFCFFLKAMKWQNFIPSRVCKIKLASKNFFFFFFFFRAAPAAYGGSRARGPTRAVAAGLHQCHSNVGSEPHLWPTPQLMAMPDPSCTEQGQGSNLHPHGS